MDVRFQKTTNLDLITRLDRKIFDEQDEIDPAVLWWVVVADDKIAGYMGLKACSEGGKPYGYLEKAGLLKPYRGHGLQKDMIAVRDREAKRLGLIMNITYTADWNLASANNLVACGYRMYEPEWKYGLKRALYFRKRL